MMYLVFKAAYIDGADALRPTHCVASEVDRAVSQSHWSSIISIVVQVALVEGKLTHIADEGEEYIE